MTKGLSPQEERFVQEFLVDRDAHQAALRTGVARINLKKTVQKWMSSPEILNAIKLATMNMKIEDMVSPQQVIAGFMDVAFDKNAPAS
ncbi:terminase small subunit, partial [Corynebacterium sp.]|uniref:terminase small subunit n=1 Tax=Corynebacterium sp. TaxID=1720 RepID=UPI002F40883D